MIKMNIWNRILRGERQELPLLGSRDVTASIGLDTSNMSEESKAKLEAELEKMMKEAGVPA